MIRIKRTDEPRARGDGQRILVERLWPRGMMKETLHADAWTKEVAPSTKLRTWSGHRVERWDEFARRSGKKRQVLGHLHSPHFEPAGFDPDNSSVFQCGGRQDSVGEREVNCMSENG